GLVALQLVVVVQVTGDVGRRRVAVGVGDGDVGQRRVAGVVDRDRVVDRAGVADQGGRGALGHRDRRAAADRDRQERLLGTGLGRVGRDRVVQRVLRVELVLGHRVGAGEGPGLVALQLGVVVQVTGDVGRRRVAVGVGDGDVGQRRVAGVVDRDRVVDRAG